MSPSGNLKNAIISSPDLVAGRGIIAGAVEAFGASAGIWACKPEADANKITARLKQAKRGIMRDCREKTNWRGL